MSDYTACHSNAFTLTRNGRYWITAVDGVISIYDTETGEKIGKSLHGRSFIKSLAVSPDVKYLISGGSQSLFHCRDVCIIIWDFKTHRQIGQLIGHKADIILLDFTPNGQYIISVSQDETIRIWSMKTFHQVWSIHVDIPVLNSTITTTNNQIFIKNIDGRSNSLYIFDNPITLLKRTLAKYIIPDLANLVEWAI